MKPTKSEPTTFPPRVWVNPERPIAAWRTDESYSGHVEYLSTAEHTHLLSEAVREAKAQVYSEIADQIDMMALYDEVDEMASEYKAKAAELRENGGKH